MLSNVEQYVRERVTDLTWRRETSEVISVSKDPAAHAEDSLRGTREAGAERHHPACQSCGIIGLDDEVRVVALQGVVDDTEVATIARAA